MSDRKALLLLLVVILIWSANGFLIKLISWNPLAISGFRGALGALLILVFLGKPRNLFSFYCMGGAIANAAAQITFISATKLTTAANAIFLQLTAPIYVALFARWFLKERSNASDWITTVAVIIGMILFFSDELTATGYWGNICGIVSGISWAWFILFLRKHKDESPLQVVFLGHVICAISGFPFMVSAMPASSSWVWLIILGFIGAGLSFMLYATVIKYLKAIEVVLVQTIEPILNPIWVLLIVGEIPGPWAIIGGIVVLTSVTFHSVIRSHIK